jgi:lipopolysaccharide/colanic/teichoic acid biosynthesis glycosyltransferase
MKPKEDRIFFRGPMEQPVYTTIRTRHEPTATLTSPAMVSAEVPVAIPAKANWTYQVAKRALDVVASLLGLLLLFPGLMLLALLVRRDSPGPVFHRRRVLKGYQDYVEGITPKTFDAFKFRTMISDADEYLRRNPHLLKEFQRDYKLREDPRITPLGHKLRTTSLDELPQLLNVLRGQMSLVGPRIISPPELANYGDHAKRLLSVKPGLTGLWQVSGRQFISYPERVRLDMWYIENRSFWLDVSILLRTVRCVFLRQGAF